MMAMRFMMLMTAAVLHVGMFSGATAQQPPARGGTQTDQALDARTKKLTELTKELESELAKRKQGSEQLLEQLREVDDFAKAVQNAESYVDRMLAELRQEIEMARMDGPLFPRLNELIRVATELAVQAENDQSPIWGPYFRGEVERFTTLRRDLEKDYADGLRAMRELEVRKRDITRAVQAEKLNLAYDALKKARDQYAAIVSRARAVADAAAEGAPRPRQ
jgi:hypothetical protein